MHNTLVCGNYTLDCGRSRLIVLLRVVCSNIRPSLVHCADVRWYEFMRPALSRYYAY